ncbi:MAG TPA: hypothetical protein PKC19_10445, partial [Roseiflexaceae bacterium]|nr:hypothetical protein [Roseiflexaceae bacterium]
RLGWAWLFGSGALSASMLLLEASGIGWSVSTIAGLLLACGAATTLLHHRHAAEPPLSYADLLTTHPLFPSVHRQPPSLPALLTLALIGGLAGLLALQAVATPMGDQDTWRIWGLLAKGYLLDGNTQTVVSRYRSLGLDSYPPGWPLQFTWGYLAWGSLAERPVRLLLPLWYAAGCTILWGAVRSQAGERAAIMATLLLATTPLLLDHATIGNADLPLGVALLAGAVGLQHWLHGGSRRRLIAGMLAILIAGGIKVDGLYLGGGMLLLAAALRLLMHPPPAAQPGRRTSIGAIILLLAIVAIPIAGSLTQRQLLPSLATLPQIWLWGGPAALREIAAELLVGGHNSARGLHGGGFGILWLVAFGGILLGLRRMWHDCSARFLLLSIIGGLAAYTGLRLIHPASATSIERYLLHIAPTALLAGMLYWKP